MSVAVGMIRPFDVGEDEGTESQWLESFHRGDVEALDRCYREQFDVVERAVGALVPGPDRETIIHDLFCELIASAEVRRGFRGGSLAAWLGTMARHRAIDHLRRRDRERTVGADRAEDTAPPWDERAEAALVIERFRRERLPPEWDRTFEALFIRQLSQREAAAALGERRTTLAYREFRIRQLLRRFVFGGNRR